MRAYAAAPRGRNGGPEDDGCGFLHFGFGATVGWRVHRQGQKIVNLPVRDASPDAALAGPAGIGSFPLLCLPGSPAFLAAALAAWLPSSPLAAPPEPGPSGSPPPLRPAGPRARSPPPANCSGWTRTKAPAPGPTISSSCKGPWAASRTACCPPGSSSEEGLLKRTASISYRTAKVLFLDLAPAAYLPLVQHEVFGHGYRAREAGFSDIRYELTRRRPTGSGTAAPPGPIRPPTCPRRTGSSPWPGPASRPPTS